MKYEKGGWVRMLVNYEEALKGEILQIIKIIDQTHVHVEKNGVKVGLGLFTTNSSFLAECEWVGMKNPNEDKLYDFKIGDWVKIADEQLPITNKWLGESDGKFTHQGPYQIEEINQNNTCVTKLSGKYCTLSFNRFTKEKPLEDVVPSTQEAQTEKWIPRNGQYAVMTQEYGGAKIGEVVKILERQGDLECHYVENLNGEGCGAPYWSYMRPVLSHEIPQKQKTYTPQKGDWIIPISGDFTDCKKFMGQCKKVISVHHNYVMIEGGIGGIYFKNLRKARPEEIPHTESEKISPIVEEESMENLVREANRRFPQGTKVRTLAGSNGESKEEVIGIVSLGSYENGGISSSEIKGYVYWKGEWATKIEERIEKEDLLEEAKRRFPIGTTFKSAQSGDLYTVKSNSHTMKCGNIDVDGIPWLYYNGKWAEIVEKSWESRITSEMVREVAFPELLEELQNYESVSVNYGTPIELRTEWKGSIFSNNGVEKMPGEIIVKKKKKVGRRLIMM